MKRVKGERRGGRAESGIYTFGILEILVLVKSRIFLG